MGSLKGRKAARVVVEYRRGLLDVVMRRPREEVFNIGKDDTYYTSTCEISIYKAEDDKRYVIPLSNVRRVSFKY